MDSVRDLAYSDYVAGMKYREIAEKHGVPLTTVKSWARYHWKKGVKKSAKKDTQNTYENDAYSWLEIENEYVTDISRKPCTLRDLANKHGIDYAYLRRYAAGHEWSKKRKNNITIVSQKTTEIITDSLAKTNVRHFKLSEAALDKIEQALSNETDPDGKELLTFVTALEKLQKIQRTAAGMLTPIDKHRIDWDNERLMLEKRKLILARQRITGEYDINPETGEATEKVESNVLSKTCVSSEITVKGVDLSGLSDVELMELEKLVAKLPVK